MGLLARFFRGGLTIPQMMTMTWEELNTWYDIYELQSVEEEIISELVNPDMKKIKLPHFDIIREMTLERIEENKERTQERLKEING